MELRSHNITKGVERVPNRSLLRACGLTEEEMARPIIGVVSAYSEIIPGHINLDKIAAAVKTGVSMAGGTPILVPAIGVCDGIAMGHIGMKYSLPSRELIADSSTDGSRHLRHADKITGRDDQRDKAEYAADDAGDLPPIPLTFTPTVQRHSGRRDQGRERSVFFAPTGENAE